MKNPDTSEGGGQEWKLHVKINESANHFINDLTKGGKICQKRSNPPLRKRSQDLLQLHAGEKSKNRKSQK